MELYLTHCFVIDCAGDELKPYAATIAIVNGKITNIDRSQATPSPEANIIDLRGAYLLPGLWDVHCHPSLMIPDPQGVSYFQTEAERTCGKKGMMINAWPDLVCFAPGRLSA
ncbi:MAG: hypothetical protein HYR94_19075 [Chloroflexi bacterium]|nr:hypothetical protein [Chloroflexota bacterium]